MKKFVLADCNNFFVSCERVFNPKLRNKPVVILSSNDCSVIARSNEAKVIGIPMGIPVFQCADLFKRHDVLALSSNFALYADMSARVMSSLATYASDIEVYSVDEAFFFITPELLHSYSYTSAAQFIQQEAQLTTGIPISLGIGSTKTLAKIANRIAKKNPDYYGVYELPEDNDSILETIDVADIWGIGYRYAKKLKNHGINTARELKYADDQWMRKNMTILGLKTVYELRGISCLTLNTISSSRQSIVVSQLFGSSESDARIIQEAAACYMQKAAAKLRKQKSLALEISVFLVSIRYHERGSSYTTAHKRLELATDYTPTLISATLDCLKTLIKARIRYRKVGVILSSIVPKSFLQLNTLNPYSDSQKKSQLMQTFDDINNKWGSYTLSFAAAGPDRPWKMKQLKKSSCFTTNWNELLTIEI